jgi:hypothetical protein
MRSLSVADVSSAAAGVASASAAIEASEAIDPDQRARCISKG